MEQYSQIFNIKDFKDLLVWQKASQVNHELYLKSKNFPKEERFELTSQLLRCSSSVAANIAEGNGQLYPKKEVTFYNNSLGSCAEARCWLYIALQRKYISAEDYNYFDSKLIEIVKMLYGCIKRLNIIIADLG